MLKKALTITLALMLTSSVFVGCKSNSPAATTPAPSSSNTVTLKDTTLTFFHANGDPLLNEIFKDRVAAFTKKYPNIKLQDITITANSYSEGLKTKDAVGEFPDLLEARDVPVWARAGKLAEMPSELTALVDSVPLLDGKAYVVPTASANSLGFFYNAKLFKDNGFTEPKNYTEFLALCEKIKAKGIAPIVAGDKDIFHVGFLWSEYWMTWVTAKNQNWIADRYAGKVKFADADVVDTFKKYTELFKKGYVEPGFISTADNQIASVLVSGKAAMFYSGTHMFKQIQDADPSFQFGWFPLADESGKITLLAGPQLAGLSYSATCDKDPAKKAAAQEFIKFFFEKDNYIDYLQRMSAFPVSKTKYDFKYPVAGMDKVLTVINDTKNRQELGWNQKWGTNEIPPAFRNYAYKVSQEWTAGSLSIEDGLKKMDAEWDVEAKTFNPTVVK